MRKIRTMEHVSLDGVLEGDSQREDGFFSDDAAPRELAFVSTKITPTGVLINTYRHVGSLSVTALKGSGK